MKALWHEQALRDLFGWRSDARIMRRLERLVMDLMRNGDAAGIGKPERLHGHLSGWSSVRIDGEHRLVYRVRGEVVEILACRGHYE